MIALDHADILQLFSGPPEVRAVNERRRCIQSLVIGDEHKDFWLYTLPVYCTYPAIHSLDGSIIPGRVDRFGSKVVDSLSPCRHTTVGLWTARGVSGERRPFMYLSACMRHRCCTQGYLAINITGLRIPQYFRGAHNSWNTGSFRLHNSFHDCPSPS